MHIFLAVVSTWTYMVSIYPVVSWDGGDCNCIFQWNHFIYIYINMKYILNKYL